MLVGSRRRSLEAVAESQFQAEDAILVADSHQREIVVDSPLELDNAVL